jgi:hypothetical protein
MLLNSCHAHWAFHSGCQHFRIAISLSQHRYFSHTEFTPNCTFIHNLSMLASWRAEKDGALKQKSSWVTGWQLVSPQLRKSVHSLQGIIQCEERYVVYCFTDAWPSAVPCILRGYYYKIYTVAAELWPWPSTYSHKVPACDHPYVLDSLICTFQTTSPKLRSNGKTENYCKTDQINNIIF